MVKEYKFKVHNTKTNEVGNVIKIKIKEYVQVEFNHRKHTYSCMRCGKKGCYVPYWKWEDIELYQYTRRKDKNDDEIYDGHIVKHPDCNDHIVIEWCWNRWIQSVYYRGEPNYRADYKWYELEIIGAIYENPELIE